MECIKCGNPCIKRGIRNKIQQYSCRSCKKYQKNNYANRRVTEDDLQMIIKLHNEGMGINSIGRILKLAASTIVKYLKIISEKAPKLEIEEIGQEYEIDEMMTYVNRKDLQSAVWIMYAINRATRKTVYFHVGRRTKETLYEMISYLKRFSPKRIYTDGLRLYSTVIDKKIHRSRKGCTNRIERKNLTLRTHLKRLNRKTICFSSSFEALKASMRVYFAYERQRQFRVK